MEVKHRLGAEFTLAQVGLVDEELDVGVVFFVDDALELVVCDGGCHSAGIGDGCGSHNAFGHFHAGKCIPLVALTHGERKSKIAAVHLGVVYILYGNSDRASVVVIDYRVVTAYFLALESVGSGSYFHSVEFKVRSYGHLGVLLEELGRNIAGNSCGNFVTYYFKRIGIYREVVGLELIHLLAATGKHHGAGEDD